MKNPCLTCRRLHNHEKRAANKANGAKKRTKPAAKQGVKPPPGGNKIGIHFEISAELMNRIRKIAEAEIRSPENQIKYMLMQACNTCEKKAVIQ